MKVMWLIDGAVMLILALVGYLAKGNYLCFMMMGIASFIFAKLEDIADRIDKLNKDK